MPPHDRPRLGFLYPGHSAEDDFPQLAERLPARPVVEIAHTWVGDDIHTLDALANLGSPELLAEGAAKLAGKVDVVVWACTSGGFGHGLDGARVQVERLAKQLDVPASSTSFAFLSAIDAMDVDRVAVAAPYTQEVADAFAAFLGEAGVEVTSVTAEAIIDPSELRTVGPERMLTLVGASDHPAAEAIVLPDTAVHTVDVLTDLEELVGKPVLTANQVSVWEALRLTGADTRASGLGALFQA